MTPILSTPEKLQTRVSASKKNGLQILMTRLLPVLVIFLFGCTGEAAAQLSASFTVDDTAGCVPVIANFVNTSTGITGTTTYTWTLGNGTPPSTLTNVSGTYLSAGTYTVTLIARDGSASSTYSTVIHVYGPPTIAFTATDTAICPGASTTFSAFIIPNSWGSVTYDWNFGDGSSSSDVSPSHSYPGSGYYNVSLFAINGKGCTNSLAKSNYIHVVTPAALSFSAIPSSFCRAPAAVSFRNTSTGTTPLTYNWNFGDGSSLAATSPTHSYLAPGSYSVQLSAVDGKGCRDTLTQPNDITIGNLSASFTPVATACGGTPVTFTNTSSSHVSSQWFFGDGTSSVDDLGTHIYRTNGTFTVKLVVFDGTCYDSTTHNISVSYPTGSFTTTPAYPCPPTFSQTFSGTSSAGSSISWLFDGGTTASGPSAVHAYGGPSIYFTSMIMTDGAGCKDTVIKQDTLFNLNVNPTAAFDSNCIPAHATYTCYAYSFVFDPVSGTTLSFTYPAAITGYTWNFGDGSPAGSGPAPVHTYTAPDSATISVTISTANGCTASGTNSIKVGTEQTPSFTVSSHRLCTGRSVYITSTSTSSALIDAYSWDFGDGTSLSGPPLTPNPVHLYTVPGIHTISLTIGYHGCPSHRPYMVADTLDSPGAAMAINFDCIPNNGVTFGDVGNGDNSHLWMFGDGTTSTANTVDHHFPALTSYTVELTTYNAASGCRDTNYVPVNVAKPPIVFLPFNSQLCRGQSDTLGIAFISSASLYNWYDNGSIISTVGSTIKDTFRVAGSHSIFLVIRLTDGCYDTSGTIHVLAGNPADSFNFTPPVGCAPLAVHFTDHSTDVAGTTMSSYYWSFGDGVTTTAFSPTTDHSYSLSGTYTVTETVTDNIGCMSTFTSSSHPLVHTPLASFTASATTVCAGTNILFTNTSTGITHSLWYFGDGITSTATSPTHAYASSGTYTVKLIVYDSFGCSSDTLTMPGLVTANFAPTASFRVSDSFAICPPLNVNFTNTSTGATSYFWMFGDGTTSSVTSPSDVYIDTGSFNPRLVATAFNGCTDTAFHSVGLFGYRGAFSYTPISGCSPFTVTFTTLLVGATAATWDFSDGSTSSSLATSVSHVYNAPGNYLPKLILTGLGCTSFSWGSDTIRVDSIIPAFTFIPNPVCENSSISFHDLSASAGYFPMTHWLWSFGSGATSTLSAPTYTYTTSGTQTITLSVTDSTGCRGIISHTVTASPAPSAIVGPSSVCLRADTLYTDPATGGTWTSSNLAVATIGSSSGRMTALTTGTTTLTYTSTSGCSVTKTVSVSPAPGIISGPPGMCIGASSLYTDTSSGGVWSIAPLTVATVSATGTVAGLTFGTAILSYTGGGCSSTISVAVSPTPSIIGGPSTVCAHGTILLTNTVGPGTWTTTSSYFSIGSSTGIVTGLAPGTGVVTYSLGSGCTQTKLVTVNPTSPITGPSGVCVGGTITLTDSVHAGYWISSNSLIATVGSTSGVVTGVASGPVTISYSLPSGCTSPYLVTVYNLPSPIGGIFLLCQYDTTTLTNTASGGTWSAASATIASIGSLSGLVTGLTAGSTTITYSLGSTGCQMRQAITVNAAPSAISTPSSLCPGSIITLTDPTIGGSWSGGSTAVATIGSSSGVVTTLAAGTTTVTYTLASTHCVATELLTVNPLPPSITGSSSVCTSLTTLLADSIAGGTWSSSDRLVATIGSGSGIVTGIGAGSVTITYTLATGCRTTYSFSTSSHIAPITGTAHVCSGSTTSLSDAAGGGYWASSNTATATVGSASGVVTGVAAGAVTISYFLGSDCFATYPVTVIAEPSPIAGSGHVCPGAPDTLTGSPSGGVWTSSASFIASVGSASGIVSGLSTGGAAISYSFGAGCTVYSYVTVNSVPSAISGTPYVCLGSATTLSDPTHAGTWSSSNSLVAPITTSGMVTGLSGGPAIISYTIADGCAATLAVTVIAVPPITGLTNACAWADTLTVHDFATGGIYTSVLATVTTDTSGFGTVYAHAPGVAIIRYTVPEGCYTTATFTTNPLPGAIMGNLHLCSGLTTTLSDSMSGGFWGVSGSTIASVATLTGLVTGVAHGTAQITYMLPTGCYTDTIVTVSPPPSIIRGADSICAGASALFSDSVSGGSWTSSNPAVASVTASTGLVTGNTPGIAIITYTLGSLCSASKVVTINPAPALFFATGGGSYCMGGTGVAVLLSGSQPGVSYQLYNGAALADTALPGAGGVLNFGLHTAAGAYTVIATNAATACSTHMPGSATISINPLPVSFAVTGGGNYCAGSAGVHIGLSGSVAGVNYQTLHSGTPVGASMAGTGSALDFGLFTAAGIYKIAATSVTTACSQNMADSAVIIIIPTVVPSVHINVSPADTVCAGTMVTFTVTSANSGVLPAYLWSVNGSTGLAASAFAYVPSNGDVVSVAMTSSATCALPDTASDAISITVDPELLPTVSITAIPGTTIARGQRDTLIAVVTGAGPAASYQWQINGGSIPGATSDTFTWNSFATGDVVSCIVSSNGFCGGHSGSGGTTIIINTVGVMTIGNTDDITVLPNPNHGEFTIKGQLNTVLDAAVTLEITDVLGQVVYKNKVMAPGGQINEKVTPGGNLANGIYVLSLHADSQNKVFHIVIER